METDPMKRNRLKRTAGKLWRPLRNAALLLLALIVLSTAMTLWTTCNDTVKCNDDVLTMHEILPIM